MLILRVLQGMALTCLVIAITSTIISGTQPPAWIVALWVVTVLGVTGSILLERAS